jgi:hypothetical protein
MKAIFNRLRRLENAVAPAERERAAAEAILEARRRRLEADYEPITFPPDWFAGYRHPGRPHQPRPAVIERARDRRRRER